MSSDEFRIEKACNHHWKRLFYVTHIEEYGECIRYAYVKKCFQCNAITEDGE